MSYSDFGPGFRSSEVRLAVDTLRKFRETERERVKEQLNPTKVSKGGERWRTDRRPL